MACHCSTGLSWPVSAEHPALFRGSVTHKGANVHAHSHLLAQQPAALKFAMLQRGKPTQRSAWRNSAYSREVRMHAFGGADECFRE